jgi:hypothetical protein
MPKAGAVQRQTFLTPSLDLATLLCIRSASNYDQLLAIRQSDTGRYKALHRARRLPKRRALPGRIQSICKETSANFNEPKATTEMRRES